MNRSLHYWIDPDVQNDPRHKMLTTRHVLTHQSGFENWRSMSASKKLEFIADPGTKVNYSGEGLEYLRRALEKKFNEPLDQLARKRLFRSYGMQAHAVLLGCINRRIKICRRS